MGFYTSRGRGRKLPLLHFAIWLALGTTAARAQGPSIDIGGPPGIPEGRGKLGRPIGAAGGSESDSTPGNQDRPLGGRPGPSTSRAPISSLNPSPRPVREEVVRFRPQVLEPASVPRYGELELPESAAAPAPPGALTLDDAIEQLLRQNLNLIALRHEIPMAQADVLTASLRANPVFYADTQLVPYGRYDPKSPGGPTQYDVNITYPLDVSRKRQARTISAEKAKKATEAQLQDAVRLQIDNLYTAYVDVVAAEETLRFSRTYAEGITQILNLNRELLKRGQVTEATTDAIQTQVDQASLQVREATRAVGRTTRTLAQVLNVPRSEAMSIRVRDTLRDDRELPQSAQTLVETALSSRPDLLAFRFGVQRASADVRLALANRFSDVYLLAQPYTYQDNRPFGLKSPTSWALGVTVPLPVYNRNQGNLERAKINVSQTRVELAALERQVADEVDEAIREFELSREAILEFERRILRASRRVRDSAYRRFQGGETGAFEFLEAQRAHTEVVRQYFDALVRHRRSMLDLNTAVGVRVLP
jgi:cobalt-zinc-cadmium efflux system outer membrane protein